MTFYDLVKKTRSYRRFAEGKRIGRDSLLELIDLARQTPSAANLQPLRYLPVCESEVCARVFGTLHWAGYLKGWGGPAPGERPAAYIILLSDASLPAPAVDTGIAAQTILLAATERGLGGCMLGAVERPALCELLGISSDYRVELVIALGVPAETVVLEQMRDGEYRYYRDEAGVHHVPKRALEDVVL